MGKVEKKKAMEQNTMKLVQEQEGFPVELFQVTVEMMENEIIFSPHSTHERWLTNDRSQI